MSAPWRRSAGASALVASPLSLVGLLALALVACQSPRSEPEQEIRELISAAESAAEARDFDGLGRMISEDYTGDGGVDRAALRRMLRLTMMRHRNIHLSTRVGEIRFVRPDHVDVSVLLAMASRPFADDATFGLNADVYRLDLQLVDEGDRSWRLIHAAWRPARGADLLLQPSPAS